MRDELYMQRCLQLALLGLGYTAPNPVVGAVLVHDNKIIGEGYHACYGEAHAEVNCLENVKDTHRHLISQSTMYVSLEPCAHYGKTPPCADLIVRHRIPKVVIGTKDIFSKVNGQGIEKLEKAGVHVILGVCEELCLLTNKRFYTFHNNKRPYIVLKWAQTINDIIGNTTSERLLISNAITNRVVHKWRAQESGILIGTRTAADDDPSLTVRWHKGVQPTRLLIDRDLRISPNANIFKADAPTVVFNEKRAVVENHVKYIKIDFASEQVIEDILHYCHAKNMQSILVEGGAETLQHFINKRLWDECRIITNNKLVAKSGVKAPMLNDAKLVQTENYLSDTIRYYHRTDL